MNMKRICSAAASVAVVCNFVAGMPLAAFAAETAEYSFAHENYTVSYNVNDSWNQNGQVSVTITNTGESTIENWMLVYDDFGAAIGDIWNAVVVETDDGKFYVRNAGYNANIEPNQSVSFGCVVSGEDVVPGDILMQQTRVSAAAADYDVSLNVKDDWGQAFNADILLRNNTDQPLEWWELDFNTNFTISRITSSWAAASTQIGDDSYRFKGTYNGIIPPHSEVALGFSGIKNSDQDSPEIGVEDLTQVVFGGYPNEIDVEAERQAEREYVESLNENAEYPVEFGFNPDGTAYSIDGKFTELSVTDGDSALEALEQIEYLLGMQDSEAVLVFDSAYSNEDTDYTVYFFHEEYRGIRVLDGNVSVVARNTGETLSLSSGFTEIPSGFSIVPEIPAAQIEAQYPDSTVSLAILPAVNEDEVLQLVYYVKGEEQTKVVSASDGTVLLEGGVHVDFADEEETDPAPDVQVINPAAPSGEVYRDGDLIYCRGTFGTVSDNGTDTPVLTLSGDEKDALQINDSDITFRFAEMDDAYYYQELSKAEYNAYLDANHKMTVIESGDTYTNVDIAANEYHFDQIYNGYQVYGRVLTETVNDAGETFIMDSNVLSADELSDAFDDITVRAGASIASVKQANSALADLDAERENPVLYTWESFEADPAMVFIFLDPDNNRTYLVSAENDNYGAILNADDASYQLGKGLDEGDSTRGRTLRYFPLVNTASNTNVMGFAHEFGDCTGKLVVKQKYRSFSGSFASVSSDEACSANTYFYEPEAVASYLNIRRSYDFYANNFNHYLDQNGKNNRDFTLTVYYKTPTWPGAFASASNGYVNLYSRNNQVYSVSTDRPQTVTHEYTHTIFDAFNRDSWSGTVNVGLNEGYAYVLGYSIFSDFTMGRSDFLIEPDFPVDFSATSLDYLIEKGYVGSGGHALAKFMYWPAYLMREAGMSTLEIGKIYYHSMTLGTYDRRTTLNTMRINLIKACKLLHFSEEKLATVRACLNTIWEHDYREFFTTINVKDAENNAVPVENISIRLFKEHTTDYLDPTAEDSHKYKIEPGEYYFLEVAAPGYLTYRNRIHMYYSENTQNIRLLPIHSDSAGQVMNGKANIIAIDRITSQPSGAAIQLEAYDENFRRIVVTDDQGHAIRLTADPVTGQTGEFSCKPGYYFPEAIDADHYFIQPMMQIPSGNESAGSPHYLYETRMNGGARSYFNDIHVDEFHEIETEFNAFDTLRVLSDEPTYQGRSGSSQFGRGMFLVFYDPDEAKDYEVVFQPNAVQLAKLQDILLEEGNLVSDGDGGLQLIDTPTNRSYYNIEVLGSFDTRSYGEGSHITATRTITAYELYQGIIENNGAYPLFTVHANGTGVLTVD